MTVASRFPEQALLETRRREAREAEAQLASAITERDRANEGVKRALTRLREAFDARASAVARGVVGDVVAREAYVARTRDEVEGAKARLERARGALVTAERLTRERATALRAAELLLERWEIAEKRRGEGRAEAALDDVAISRHVAKGREGKR